MNKIEHHYAGTPFSIEATPILSNNGWSKWRVEIFANIKIPRPGKDKIGEYVRHYPSFVKETFYPFDLKDEWYALYSSDYTCTRVAKITHTFEDWCGEEPNAYGFCPVEFYVPRYHTFESSLTKEDGTKRILKIDVFDNDVEESEFLSKICDDAEYAATNYTPFGFMSGCVWGDDSSWKLRYIDLSKVEEKELRIDERFGYWRLPDRPLRECVHFVDDHDSPWLFIQGQKTFDLDKCEWED